MPLLVILLLAFLVIQFGFWDTFAGILGGIGIIFLMILTAAAATLLAGMLAVKRMGRR
jgi:hypothetical protein